MAAEKKPTKKASSVPKTLKDPLNWALLVLGLAFAYYIIAIPYWQNFYLKEDAQVMSLQDYMANPSHPRPIMWRALGTPPSSIEVIISDLTVKHIDTDSITLTSDPGSGNSSANAGACDAPPMLGEEASPPLTDIMVAGDNMDLLEISEGQQVTLQVFGVHQTDMGWVPLEPTLDSDQEERFSKDELDALELLKIHVDGNVVEVPYVETGELRLASGVHATGEAMTLADLSDDTNYIQTVNRLAGGLIDLHGVRLSGWRRENLQPFFEIEDDEGRQARVFYNQRLLSEWRWGLDKLEGQCVVVRGSLRSLTPAQLRQLESDGNIQALIEGFAVLSNNGSVIINLENPLGGFGTGTSGTGR